MQSAKPFAGKDRYDFRYSGKGRQDQDINFRMAENPKEMLPENCRTTRFNALKVRRPKKLSPPRQPQFTIESPYHFSENL
jgi:hypothetical protein